VNQLPCNSTELRSNGRERGRERGMRGGGGRCEGEEVPLDWRRAGAKKTQRQ